MNYNFFFYLPYEKHNNFPHIDGHRLNIGDEGNHWHREKKKSWHASYAIKHYTVHDFHTPKGVVVEQNKTKMSAHTGLATNVEHSFIRGTKHGREKGEKWQKK